MTWYTDLSDWFADAPRHVGDTLSAGLTDVRDGASWAWDGVHAAGHDAHVLEARSEAVLEALWDGAKLALIGAQTRLASLDVSAIIDLLLDALLDALKTVAKGVLMGAAIGAVDGAFVGGIGALPGAIAGAAAGFDAAMTYLTVLGLRDMAHFVIDDAIVALRSLATGMAMAWYAPADPSGHWVRHTPRDNAIMAAAHVLSEGLIALAILIFMGLAAFLLHNGGKLGKLAEAIGRAKPLGPKFVSWVDRHAGKLVEWSKRADTGNVRPAEVAPPIDALPPERASHRIARADDTPPSPAPGDDTDTRTASATAGSIRNVNAVGGTMNCVNCSLATDATLAGRPASALDSGPQPIRSLESLYGARFGPPGSIDDISAQMQDAGSGARGIVFGSRGAQVGHVFNAVNQNGVIRFLDGQTGGAAALNGYQSFQLLRTN